MRRDARRTPRRECKNVIPADVTSVFGAQQILKQDTKREWQMRGGRTFLIERINTKDFILAVADTKSGTSAKAIHDVLLLIG